MSTRSDAGPTYKPRPLSLAEFARRVGRHRSVITREFQNGLGPAKLPNGRVDAAHPLVHDWLRARDLEPAVLLDGAISVAETRGAPAAVAAVADSTRPSKPSALLAM